MDRITSLRAFIRLAELGSFSAVASELRVGQPTISKWIAALEEEFSARLVDRTTRTQRVTNAGEALLERARHILAAYDQTVAQLSATSPELRGRLRISVPTVFGPRYCVAPVLQFMHAHPAIECELIHSDDYVDLIGEAYDLAIRVGAPQDSQLKARVLATTRRCLVASPDYLRDREHPRDPSDLAEHACLLLRSAQHSGQSAAQTWTFRRAGYTMKARAAGPCSANNSESVLNMARLGGGVALLAEWLVRDALDTGDLVELFAPDPERAHWAAAPAPISALMPPGRYVAPRVRAFVDHLIGHFSEQFPN